MNFVKHFNHWLSSYRLSMTRFVVLFSIFNLVAYNISVFGYALDFLNPLSLSGVLILFSIAVAIFSLSTFLFLLIATVLPFSFVRAFIVLVMLSNSIALYFVNTYNVILDKSMMGNVLNTRSSEAFSYYDPKIFIYLFLLGVIPSYIVSKITIIKTKRVHLVLSAFGILGVGVFVMYLNASTWLWLDKHAKHLGGLAMPWSYSINMLRFEIAKNKKNKKIIPLPNAIFSNENKMLVVLVIGESARSSNFSLYGYKKETNPKLKKQNLIVLKNTKSTATYTTASVHSMLSHLGSESDSYEILPNYLQREGVDVLWRANNWGEPPLKNVSYEGSDALKKGCTTQGCEHDEVLLHNLRKKIMTFKKDKLFVVLHTNGSHGPTYYKKYPKKFEVFKPICKSVDLKTCTDKELMNAYDNTILYTDYFLDETINMLKTIKDRPVLFIYISDHGESLGEYGLYLHGTPYSIAPDVQKNIPFFMWESDSFLKMKGFPKPYVRQEESYGQYNIFHTIMGAFGMKSDVYNEKLDLLRK